MGGEIFSPGKLLITAEYLVLDGALALAVPTKPGQRLGFEEVSDGLSRIHWQALHQDKPWLEAVIDYSSGQIIEANLPDAAAFVLKLFRALKNLAPQKFNDGKSFHFKSNLEFPADFGLGSSSTLMANLAGWAGVDAFALNGETLGGSGYDVAVAQQKSAILYQLSGSGRRIERINFNPPFSGELVFIHLNQKQNSREGISLYKSRNKSQPLVDEISAITRAAAGCEDLNTFSVLMHRHEMLISSFLGINTAKELYFEDCPAFVKSLGAWGGDFVMSIAFPGWRDYFRERGFGTVFTWQDLILY